MTKLEAFEYLTNKESVHYLPIEYLQALAASGAIKKSAAAILFIVGNLQGERPFYQSEKHIGELFDLDASNLSRAIKNCPLVTRDGQTGNRKRQYRLTSPAKDGQNDHGQNDKSQHVKTTRLNGQNDPSKWSKRQAPQEIINRDNRNRDNKRDVSADSGGDDVSSITSREKTPESFKDAHAYDCDAAKEPSDCHRSEAEQKSNVNGSPAAVASPQLETSHPPSSSEAGSLTHQAFRDAIQMMDWSTAEQTLISYGEALRMAGIGLPETNDGDLRAAHKLLKVAQAGDIGISSVVYEYIAHTLLRGNERLLMRKHYDPQAIYIRNLIDFVKDMAAQRQRAADEAEYEKDQLRREAQEIKAEERRLQQDAKDAEVRKSRYTRTAQRLKAIAKQQITDHASYTGAIEDAYSAIRSKHLLLYPKDHEICKALYEAGVPVTRVLKALIRIDKDVPVIEIDKRVDFAALANLIDDKAA